MIQHSLFVLAACVAPILGVQSQFLGPNFVFPNSTSPQRFDIHVNQSFIEFTIEKTQKYRPIRTLSEDWSEQGPPASHVTELAEYWAKSYSWADVETEINQQFEHYAITLPGNGNYTDPILLHFIHKRANDSTAIPLLLIHGWGSSHLEWTPVVDKLVQGNQSFHVVAIDLPGFGFSPAATMPGLRSQEMGIAFDALMKQLGYDTYGLVTTDLGWILGMPMMQNAGSSMIGHFTDMWAVVTSESDRERQARNETTPEENKYIASNDAFSLQYGTHAIINTQKSVTASVSFSDSPIGFAGYLWDLLRSFSDGYEYSYLEIITETMMQWIQGPYGRVLTYFNIASGGLSITPTDIPIGVAEFGWANGPFPALASYPLVPRSWIERQGVNLTYFNRLPAGGHWPARNVPDIWVQELRNFFATI
ncbi:alpha/beta-hydrolase [Corynespora cassiicola Philippines]|uniref:Alpha/beta-hydrolase n=1 Tax=Corynespora cassiicola Philippines TaxID=1448308 RepID=A0A2T2N4V4_CORCC|nr:alpha/beta-hydrolase [Corynespora cassiicola Philippines]